MPALFFSACISSNREAFEAPPDLTQTKTDLIDTFSISMKTYRFDSINTAGKEYLFAGSYQDLFLGKISAESYFQVLPASYPLVFPDSIIENTETATFSFRYDYTIGLIPDTLEKFALHRLTQSLSGEKSYFSNSDATPYEPDTFATTLKAKVDKRILSISSPKMASALMAQWKAWGSFTSDAQFLGAFKGFAFKAIDPKPYYICRFDLRDSAGFPPANLQLSFKRVVDGVEKTETISFRTNASTAQYFRVKTDFSGKPWENIPDNTGLSTSQTSGYAIVQAGVGFALKIEIPGVYSWAKSQTKKIKVFKAELVIEPEKPANIRGGINPPNLIRLSNRVDFQMPEDRFRNQVIYNDNQIFAFLQVNRSLAEAFASSSSQYFEYNSTVNSYKCNITRHVQAMVDGIETSSSINVFPVEFLNSFNTMLIKPQNVKLKVFYYPL